MLLNLVVSVLIILIALYLANQGMLSALLALATALFSSILAMALMEPLQGIIGGWRPDYARGVTFLLTFFLAFSATRIIADMSVPKTIKLSLLINRVSGGIIGFFTGMIVVGTVLIGVELLPVSRSIMGFDRFPGSDEFYKGGKVKLAGDRLAIVWDANPTAEPGHPLTSNYMQGGDGDRLNLGEIARPRNVWFKPDRFVLAIWNGASGRSLGGGRAFASVHPDLTVEAYAYRNHVDGSHRTLSPDLLEVKDAWIAEAELRTEHGPAVRPEPGKRFVMVRTVVKKGDKEPNVSAESGDPAYFYISASQVRLVTNKAHQYYPIGYFESGSRFVPLTLDNGFVVDDYVRGANVVEDWIFQVSEDEMPATIEVKQLAQKDLTAPGILHDKISSLNTSEYPSHAYLKDVSTLTVTFDPTPKKRDLKVGRVYVLNSVTLRREIPDSVVGAAHRHVLDCDSYMANTSNGWDATFKPGVPNLANLTSAERVGQTILNDPGDAPINWYGLVNLLMLGQIQSNGASNLNLIPTYFEDSFVPMLKGAKSGSLIVASGVSDPAAHLNETGRVAIEKIAPGNHTVLVTMEVSTNGASRAFFVWVKDLTFKAATPQSFTVSDGDTASSFHIDLDEKP